MRGHDWSLSSLGHPEQWPLSLRVLVRHMLASSFPMAIAWGPELTFMYNDAYLPILGSRHPAVLGRPLQEVWSDAWHGIGPLVERALAGDPCYGENQPLVLRRRGRDEPAWFTFSYSPAYGDDGRIGGMYCACIETTAQVQAERSLRRWTETLESKIVARTAERDRIWRISKDILAIASLEGHVISVNPAITDILGWSIEEATSVPFISFAHPDQKNEVLSIVTRLAQGESISDFQVRARHKDGGYRWLSWTIVPEETHLYGVARDITESRLRQKQAEDANNARLQLALEAGQMGAWQWDIRRNAMTWWPGMDAIHGLPEGAMLESLEDYQALVHPEDRASVAAFIATAPANRKKHRIEYRIVWPDGSVHWIEGRGEAFFDARGDAVQLAGVCMDVTHRKRTERDLAFVARTSEELSALVDYRATLDKVARFAVPHFADWCAVDMLDEQGELQRVAVAHINPDKVELAHELHDKYPPDAVAGTGAWHVIRSGKPELVTEITPEMLAVGIKDKQYLDSIQALGLRSYIGVPLCRRDKAYGAITFITAESGRLYNADDLALAEDLSRRAAIAIENANLYRALQESDRAKDQFLATLAHELRNPLAPINTIPPLVRSSSYDMQTTRRAMDILERQAGHLIRLVDDLLDVSRVTTGKIELKKRPASLTAILNNAIETSRVNIDAAGVVLHLALPDTPTGLMADQVRLEQVFTNILNNAAKFTRPGGRIDVALEHAGTGYVVRVRDTGIGISPDKLRSIFGMFAQEKSPQEHAQGGLGIGLALVDALVRLHEGDVEARSDGPGKGTEFIVFLPKGEFNADHGAVPPQPPQPPQLSRPSETADAETGIPCRKKGTVLLVEDNIDAAKMMSALLAALGHEVSVSHSGADAIRQAGMSKFDTILLDIGLPDMEGTRVAQAIRDSALSRYAHVVALSGWSEANIQKLPGAGCFDEFWVKPVGLDRIETLR